MNQSISQSTAKKAKPRKPAKPYKDFPLFPHASGRWCKKILGKHEYFGKWDDPDAAIAKYLREREDLYAGRRPRAISDGLTIKGLLNRYLTAKRNLLTSKELVPTTFTAYQKNCDRIEAAFGLNRLVEDLASDDFGHLRTEFSKTLGPNALGKEIQRTRSLFKFAYDAGLIDQPVRHGPAFKFPNRAVLRKARNEKPPRMLTAAQIRDMLSIARPQLKAMLMLGVNCGFGNHDVGLLPQTALDLDGGVGCAKVGIAGAR